MKTPSGKVKKAGFVQSVRASLIYTIAQLISNAAEGLLNDDDVDQKACDKLARRILKELGLVK